VVCVDGLDLWAQAKHTAVDSRSGRNHLGWFGLYSGLAVHVFPKLERYSPMGSGFLCRAGLYDGRLSRQRHLVQNGPGGQSHLERAHSSRIDMACAENFSPIQTAIGWFQNVNGWTGVRSAMTPRGLRKKSDTSPAIL